MAEWGPDELLTCLARLADASRELSEQVRQYSQWEAAGGLPYHRTVPLRQRVAAAGHISAAIRTLTREGSRFRRAEARALYSEGLTMAQLAGVFGVSRQRVAMVMREPPGPQPSDRGAEEVPPGRPPAGGRGPGRKPAPPGGPVPSRPAR